MNNQTGSGAGQTPGAQHAGTVETENPGGGLPGKRHEVGDAASSRLHPPHVTENDEDAAIQAEHPEGGPVAALPANASGKDQQPADGTAQHIRPESMYENRPAEDKDSPPSTRTGA